METRRAGLSLRHRLALAAAPCVTTPVCLLGLRSGWAAILAYHGVILLSLAVWGRNAGVRPFAGRWTPLSITVCFLSAMTGPALYLLLPSISRGSLHDRLVANGLSGVAWLLLIPYFSLVNPALEEMYWRGLLAPRDDSSALGAAEDDTAGASEKSAALAKGLRPGNGIFDLLFAAYHLAVLPLFVNGEFVAIGAVVLAMSGFTWRALTTQSGGLLPAIVSHALADVGIICAVAIYR